MEPLAGFFKDLYTNFLLRDFAGKIVPGAFLFFSLAAMFANPADLLKTLSSKLSILLMALCGGFAWIVVLGLQALATGDWLPQSLQTWRLWSYYPTSAGSEMNIQTEIVSNFLRIACPDERIQYERYVVIKEATGNLFTVSLLSLPVWTLWLYGMWENPTTRSMIWGDIRTNVRTIIVGLYCLAIGFGLHLMNVEHVKKQFSFADLTLKSVNKLEAPRSCGPANPSGEKAKQS